MIHLSYEELGKQINEKMRKPIDEAAAQIASHVDVGSVDAPVGTKAQTSDRGWPIAVVAIMHPAGRAIQAKHGALTKAAAECGLEVTSK